MNRIPFYFLVCMLGLRLQGQPGPWNNDLVIAQSWNGNDFFGFTLFQDSAGVPSLIDDGTGRLIAAFQWFPAPAFIHPHFDRVAVKFSYDQGVTWSYPQPIVVNSLPPGYQRPFDPTLTLTETGQIRIYFSSSAQMPPGGLDSTINTYSAISSDGVHYTFEPGARYDLPTRPLIDPAVVKFNGNWHYTSPKGAPQEGANHAFSQDGLLFSPLPDIPSDPQHNWTGNLMVNHTPFEMRFYGTGTNGFVWWVSTIDGSNWSPYHPTNVNGADPGIVRLPGGKFLIIYVNMGNFVGLNSHENQPELELCPNPFTSFLDVTFHLSSETTVEIDVYSPTGRLVASIFRGRLMAGKQQIQWSGTGHDGIPVPDGLYLVKVNMNGYVACSKVIRNL
jgi:hypothetical protein